MLTLKIGCGKDGGQSFGQSQRNAPPLIATVLGKTGLQTQEKSNVRWWARNWDGSGQKMSLTVGEGKGQLL